MSEVKFVKDVTSIGAAITNSQLYAAIEVELALP
jgi:hypothetical protein